MNMIEILSNWNTYVPNSAFITQRGATILLNEKDEEEIVSMHPIEILSKSYNL